jgi:hypothetical protein
MVGKGAQRPVWAVNHHRRTVWASPLSAHPTLAQGVCRWKYFRVVAILYFAIIMEGSRMPLFKITGKVLSNIKEDPFKLEKKIQTLTEANLETLFGFQFVYREFERERLRVDTLGFDRNSNSFVIIEYKRDQSFSVVDLRATSLATSCPRYREAQ